VESKYPASTPLNTGHNADDDDDMEPREMLQIMATVRRVKAMRRNRKRTTEGYGELECDHASASARSHTLTGLEQLSLVEWNPKSTSWLQALWS
jgi:hypothetical protein